MRPRNLARHSAADAHAPSPQALPHRGSHTSLPSAVPPRSRRSPFARLQRPKGAHKVTDVPAHGTGEGRCGGGRGAALPAQPSSASGLAQRPELGSGIPERALLLPPKRAPRMRLELERCGGAGSPTAQSSSSLAPHLRSQQEHSRSPTYLSLSPERGMALADSYLCCCMGPSDPSSCEFLFCLTNWECWKRRTLPAPRCTSGIFTYRFLQVLTGARP